MSKAAQYYNAATQEWSQWPAGGLTTDDYTLTGNIISDSFETIKDVDDNLYILCTKTGGYCYPKIIVLDKDVNKKISQCTNSLYYNSPYNLILSKDKSKLILGTSGSQSSNKLLRSVLLSSLNSSTFEFTTEMEILSTPYIKFAIYKGLYIWVASGSTVKIYDYTTKAELAAYTDNNYALVYKSINIDPIGLLNCVCTANAVGYQSSLLKLRYDGVPALFKVSQTGYGNTNLNDTMQSCIDPFGDIVSLTQYAYDPFECSLVKVNGLTGAIIETKVLGQPSYNLAIDTKGNYYYQTALATFKIAKNTIQGQAFNPIPAEPMRATGNIGYGSNMTGYQPSVNA